MGLLFPLLLEKPVCPLAHCFPLKVSGSQGMWSLPASWSWSWGKEGLAIGCCFLVPIAEIRCPDMRIAQFMVYFQEGRIVTDTCILVATEFPVRFILSVTVRSSSCLFTATQGFLEIVYQTGNLSVRIYARYGDRFWVKVESLAGCPGSLTCPRCYILSVAKGQNTQVWTQGYKWENMSGSRLNLAQSSEHVPVSCMCVK